VGSRRPSFDKRKGSGRHLIRCGVLGEVIRSTSAFADRIAGAWSTVHQGPYTSANARTGNDARAEY
jgi:hypothetical protein